MRLVDAVQDCSVERYGTADRTPVDPAEFAAPRGTFLLGCLDEVAVCCGGWRRHTAATIAPADRGVLLPDDTEIERMWVEPAYRRQGLARRVLTGIERTAALTGCRRTVLETGTRQPGSIALYRRAGYVAMPRFEVYRDDPGSLCLVRHLPHGGPSDPCGRPRRAGG